jgi:methylenetetrahydrofolate reductase (NADPH)
MSNVSLMEVKTEGRALQALLQTYSTEVVSKDHKGIAAAAALLRPGSEVFVASLPNDSADVLIAACTQLRRAGMTPVPHIPARTTPSRAVLDDTLRRLAGEAAVERALVIGGDVDHAVGEFDAAIQLIETGLFQQHGIKRIALAVHPEGHPRVPDAVMWPALPVKLAAAKAAGLETYLVAQFAFEAAPIVALAQRLRAAGIDAPLRVGVAGPAKRTTLIKYALMCGVGPSLRALRERQDLAMNVLSGETPEALLRDIATARAADPSLGIEGVHFFTFGSLQSSVTLAESLRQG